jgi:hypothetical protein
MKKTRLLLALLAAFALIAAACGSDSDDGGDAGADRPDVDAGSGGELLLLQWQAPSQANGLLSNGTKDILAASLVNEPLARFDATGAIQATLAAEIPTVENGGVAGVDANRTARETVELINAVQRWHLEETRLGIPVMMHEEGLHGFAARGATHFPQAIALASTWGWRKGIR